MKARFVSFLCILALLVVTTSPARATDGSSPAMIADVVAARPLCFAATLIGSAMFVVAWPFAATSGSVSKTAEVLVKAPARATFKRPIGEFSLWAD
jgi:hypothetical protein